MLTPTSPHAPDIKGKQRTLTKGNASQLRAVDLLTRQGVAQLAEAE
jgi:hypothetical protein